MPIAAKKARNNYKEIRTSGDGRQYVTVSDVLNSPAGLEEIRKHGEIFRILKEKDSNGSSKSTNGNGNGHQ